MNEYIIVAIIAGSINIVLWVAEKLYKWRRDAIEVKHLTVETKKDESETRNLDAETISSLSTSMSELNRNHIETLGKMRQLSEELDGIKSEQRSSFEKIQALETENKKLRDKNEIVESAIYDLQKENLSLKRESESLKKESESQRSLIEFERNESIKLKIGIGKLVKQLRDIPLTPAWTPAFVNYEDANK